jgi:hypothetical protein
MVWFGMFCMAVAAPAQAMPITLEVSGVIDQFLRGGVIEDIPLGSSFSMTINWETDTVVSDNSRPNFATYYGALTGATVLAHDVYFTMSPADGRSAMTIGNDTVDSMAGYITDDTVTSSVDDLALWHLRWELLFPNDTWTSTALPTTLPDLLSGGAKLYIYSQYEGHDVSVHATLNEAHSVPEPSALLLSAMGLVGAWGFRRRRALS